MGEKYLIAETVGTSENGMTAIYNFDVSQLTGLPLERWMSVINERRHLFEDEIRKQGGEGDITWCRPYLYEVERLGPVA